MRQVWFEQWLRYAAIVLLGLSSGVVFADDDVTDLTSGAKVAATKPAEVTGPETQASTQPGGMVDALGTMHSHAPAQSRQGVVTLNDGTALDGTVWTTLDTPLRVWVEETKSYRDIELGTIKRIDVHVRAEAMEDDWRWLKEGSDKKVFSGKKYPNVEMTYKFTLSNDQVVEGGVVAPIYLLSHDKKVSLALYKKYKGKLDETLKDLVYIKSIVFDETETQNAKLKVQNGGGEATTKLPLIY